MATELELFEMRASTVTTACMSNGNRTRVNSEQLRRLVSVGGRLRNYEDKMPCALCRLAGYWRALSTSRADAL